MKYLATYLLLKLGGNDAPSADDIKVGSLLRLPPHDRTPLDGARTRTLCNSHPSLLNTVAAIQTNFQGVLAASNIEVAEEDLTTMLGKLEGKDLKELIEAGKEKLSKFGGGGGGGAAAAGGAGAAAEEEEEEEEEKEEEVDMGGGAGLFGDDDDDDY